MSPPHLSFFFIVGCPRSGTTLLQRLLDAHPDVAVAPETFFLRHLDDHRARFSDLRDEATFRAFLDALFAQPAMQDMNLAKSLVRDALPPASRSWQAVFRTLLEQFAAARGAVHVGEKTPSHVLHVDTLRRWFPDATLLHLVRDPRAVVNSWRHVPWSSGYRWRDAEVWVEYVSAGRQAEADHPEHVASVPFESLVRRPAPTLRRVCTALGLPFRDDMLALHDAETTAVNVSREPWKQRALTPIDPAVADRWRTELSEGAQAQVEAVAADEMQHWGYACETSAVHRSVARLRSAIERPLWKARTLVPAA